MEPSDDYDASGSAYEPSLGPSRLDVVQDDDIWSDVPARMRQSSPALTRSTTRKQPHLKFAMKQPQSSAAALLGAAVPRRIRGFAPQVDTIYVSRHINSRENIAAFHAQSARDIADPERAKAESLLINELEESDDEEPIKRTVSRLVPSPPKAGQVRPAPSPTKPGGSPGLVRQGPIDSPIRRIVGPSPGSIARLRDIKNGITVVTSRGVEKFSAEDPSKRALIIPDIRARAFAYDDGWIYYGNSYAKIRAYNITTLEDRELPIEYTNGEILFVQGFMITRGALGTLVGFNARNFLARHDHPEIFSVDIKGVFEFLTVIDDEKVPRVDTILRMDACINGVVVTGKHYILKYSISSLSPATAQDPLGFVYRGRIGVFSGRRTMVVTDRYIYQNYTVLDDKGVEKFYMDMYNTTNLRLEVTAVLAAPITNAVEAAHERVVLAHLVQNPKGPSQSLLTYSPKLDKPVGAVTIVRGRVAQMEMYHGQVWAVTKVGASIYLQGRDSTGEIVSEEFRPGSKQPLIGLGKQP